MKRFYQDARAIEADDEYAVQLDGKPLQTPAKRALRVPSRALADAIAAEWQGQGAAVSPATLPLTRLVSTAIDRVAPQRHDIVAEIANYAATDLLCYRAAEPPELVERQARLWQPLLDWAEARYGAALIVTQGVTPVPQPPAALAAIERATAAHDAPALVALHLATACCGSVVLGLALMAEHITPAEAFAAAQLEESFEIERWGEDAEQTQRRAALKEDIALAARFAALLRGD
ncbi:MAG TPA: ATP12 family protein [Stellaceae bacterium]|jgi:chaperone required for assembly of F1-ATPase|nr:ATP12 family protein [Stellaceae bacterium]